MTHTLKEAKNNLDELIHLAENGEPQTIERDEQEVAVVVSISDWRKMSGQKESLVEFLQNSPLDEILPFLDRPEDFPREVSFE